VYRTDSASVTVTNHDGRDFPDDTFDRILLDAPCTGEGRRVRQDRSPADAGTREAMARLQQGLIERAADLLSDGGRLVYATCTFAPAENEAVVAHALDATDLDLADIDPAVPHSRGVVSFEDQTYPDAVRNTVRIYPHHLDSGGMYVAAFER
ncbi:MAG: SAM-dependent methyltransferase, partial [Candidatus Nanohaloarchaea archaeon]